MKTYDELKREAANYLTSNELIPFIPTAIRMHEAWMNREIKAREMVNRAYIEVGDQYVTLPSDFIAMRTAYLTDPLTRLEFMPLDALKVAKECDYRSAGQPQAFTIIGSEIELLPAPNKMYELEATYYAQIPSLSDDTPTNWMLERNPDIYLYGALMQAAPYMGQDRRVATWAELLTKAVDELRLQTERAEFPDGALRARARPLP